MADHPPSSDSVCTTKDTSLDSFMLESGPLCRSGPLSRSLSPDDQRRKSKSSISMAPLAVLPVPRTSPIKGSSSHNTLKEYQLEKKHLLPVTSLLREQDHQLIISLVRGILNLRFSDPQNALFRRCLVHLLSLHEKPDSLFFASLHHEIEADKELSLLMRGDLSVCVCVMKFFLMPHRKELLVLTDDLLSFVFHLKLKQIDLIIQGSDTPGGKKCAVLKKKLQRGVQLLLQPNLLPEDVCVMCYRCVAAVEKSDIKKDIAGTVAGWAVGALLFLRFIIPVLTSFSSDNTTKLKAVTFLGRFLMKLCCKSLFGQGKSTSVANEVLTESFDKFDQFGQEVVERGEKAWVEGDSIGYLLRKPRKGWACDLLQLFEEYDLKSCLRIEKEEEEETVLRRAE
eukprot:CAMPEP_0201478864 /NCGR_PEP_ID=MMETSP0151_2-20130828/3624_1 /ASSEMBLY_ACC=CAM_ASM_000257 /TAXON_ID=200890 /ORGANISM="Paramoeba atlantica, Strain 621/1 / CCAP 1560/9" /LENGTH=395 /DNA_ID=CAMNT_0047860089 /DNA_START=101 /DNA_END=1285 /DNA_ORIENTATION=+